MTETESFETIRYTADVVVLTPGGDTLLIERVWPPYEGDWPSPAVTLTSERRAVRPPSANWPKKPGFT